MRDIDVVDSTWICTPPGTLAALVAEPGNWRRWWPALELTVDEWRGNKGVRWTVGPSERGSVVGSMEVWLEPRLDGVVAHFFLRLGRADGRPLGRRRVRTLTDRYRTSAKELFWALGNQLDPGRVARVSERRQVACSE
ncbi:MAG: polyketide cyclase / dehydrase and lipid transport [Jatrophihabitantaceae bacterium]